MIPSPPTAGLPPTGVKNAEDVYETPKVVTNLKDCNFYHAMDLPGYGTIKGSYYDLRGKEDEYLGHINVQGKRVLEIGTASGHLCFFMEKHGAEVVAFDLSPNYDWDIVPYACHSPGAHAQARREKIRKFNNAFWLAHRCLSSHAKVVYGSVYNIPRDIGVVDIAVFGAVLLHVRDPFLALQNALSLTKETVVITELYNKSMMDKGPVMRFAPPPNQPEHFDKWWSFSPHILQHILSVLGFSTPSISYHTVENRHGETKRLFTIVAQRTQAIHPPTVKVPS